MNIKLNLKNRVLLSAALCAICNWSSAVAASEKPNLLFLITDQQTIDALSCAGNPYLKTPNMDRLAARGVRFEKSYCTFPLCGPSRASLFTSLMPHEVRIYENFDIKLADKGLTGQTMGELFESAGYEAAYAGKWHLNMVYPGIQIEWGKNNVPGFEVLPMDCPDPNGPKKADGKGLLADPAAADAAIAFLQRSHAKPFLLVASIMNPHDICEYEGSPALHALLPDDPSKLPPPRKNTRATETLPTSLLLTTWSNRDWTDRQWSEYLHVYYRLTEIADEQIGRILDALDRTGLAQNTVIVFTSDHGEMMGSHQMVTKQKLYEESVAVPLIVAEPNGRSAVDKTHLVSGLDIMPTLLDYAGIAAPKFASGRSLRPVVAGKKVPWREAVFAEVNVYFESRMVRTDRYKYIVYAKGENREQLFDMEKDSLELKNRINDPELAAEVARHRRLLEQWRQETHDTEGAGDFVLEEKKKAAARLKSKTHTGK